MLKKISIISLISLCYLFNLSAINFRNNTNLRINIATEAVAGVIPYRGITIHKNQEREIDPFIDDENNITIWEKGNNAYLKLNITASQEYAFIENNDEINFYDVHSDQLLKTIRFCEFATGFQLASKVTTNLIQMRHSDLVNADSSDAGSESSEDTDKLSVARYSDVVNADAPSNTNSEISEDTDKLSVVRYADVVNADAPSNTNSEISEDTDKLSVVRYSDVVNADAPSNTNSEISEDTDKLSVVRYSDVVNDGSSQGDLLDEEDSISLMSNDNECGDDNSNLDKAVEEYNQESNTSKQNKLLNKLAVVSRSILRNRLTITIINAITSSVPYTILTNSLEFSKYLLLRLTTLKTIIILFAKPKFNKND